MDMKTYRFGVLGAGSMGKTIAAGDDICEVRFKKV